MNVVSRSLQVPILKLDILQSINSPREILIAGKEMINRYVQSFPKEQGQIYGQSIVHAIVSSYWDSRFSKTREFTVPYYSYTRELQMLDDLVLKIAKLLGLSAAKLDVIEASYLIGNIYTATVPDDTRSTNGVYYTPPNLTVRLLNLAERAGVNWQTAKILDPACGGGAFLAPVALRMVSALQETDPERIISHVERHLKGYEIDAFSAWLSQVFVEMALSKYSMLADRRPKIMIDILDSLSIEQFDRQFDLIIGNPPYGKIKLHPQRRAKYAESLYGHANLYGLFVHLAFELVKPDGVIAFLTPTGFLGGEYFKNLRRFICNKGEPVEFDFVSFRKGIFDDVLQETMLTTYKASTIEKKPIVVNEIIPASEKKCDIRVIGRFSLPSDSSMPWVLSRNKHQSSLVKKLYTLNQRLRDWGYEVKTGPLVWNRHKKQLKKKKDKNHYPLIWAEAITSTGEFLWRAERRSHTPYFAFEEGDEWLLTGQPCIILQRTTAKEQQRRLISALVTADFIADFGNVVIENHLNIVKPITDNPLVSMRLLHLFLNSVAADNAFRCISGSVAVSAYELENMPLPSSNLLSNIQEMVNNGANTERVNEAFLFLYK